MCVAGATPSPSLVPVARAAPPPPPAAAGPRVPRPLGRTPARRGEPTHCLTGPPAAPGPTAALGAPATPRPPAALGPPRVLGAPPAPAPAMAAVTRQPTGPTGSAMVRVSRVQSHFFLQPQWFGFSINDQMDTHGSVIKVCEDLLAALSCWLPE